MGAHVLLLDDGSTYKEWSENPAFKTGRSSHPSNDQQYRMSGKLVKELLFSTVKHEGKVHTWFQLESHPMSFGHVALHMLAYVKYKLSGRNQGPYGSSHHVDQKPLIIPMKNP